MTQPNEELKPYRSERFFIHGPIFGSDPGMCPVSQAEKVTAWLNAEYERNCHTQSAPKGKREWKADDVVGEINTDDHALGGCGCGCVPRNIDVKLNNLSPEVQDALNGRKG